VKREVYSEVRMTVNLKKVYESRMTDKMKGGSN
jgi:ribosomal protein L31E